VFAVGKESTVIRLLFLLVLFCIPINAQTYLVGFKPDTPATELRAVARSRTLADLDVYVVDSQLARVLARNPWVEFIEENRVVPPSLTPNDPLFPTSWAFTNISAAAAWDVTTGGPIVIAILDTGLDSAHPDIQGKFIPGWNVFNNNADTFDVTGHGTFVSLVAGAASNNSIANPAVCWGCPIMPIRISDSQGFASFADAADGINWARTHGAKVANISYEMTGSMTVSRAAKKLVQAGGLVVIAAGNAGLFRCCDDIWIVTVGATDQMDQLTSYSNFGPQIDLNAPGHWSQLCNVGGQYFNCGSDGTSISGPQVAGAAALVWTINPLFTPAQVEAKLESTSDNLRLNLFGAVQ